MNFCFHRIAKTAAICVRVRKCQYMERWQGTRSFKLCRHHCQSKETIKENTYIILQRMKTDEDSPFCGVYLSLLTY